MRGRTVKSPERVAEAQRMRAEGYSSKTIAQCFGVSETTAGRWAPRRTRTPRAENVGRALALQADGLSVKEIAAAMSVKAKTVYAWFEDPAGDKDNARKRASDQRAIEAKSCQECGGPVGTRTSVICQSCRDRPHRERRAEILALRAAGMTNKEIEQHLRLPYNAAASAVCRERARGVVATRSPYWERGKDKSGMNQVARKALERDHERTKAQIAEREAELDQLRAYLSGLEAALAAFEGAMANTNGHHESA